MRGLRRMVSQGKILLRLVQQGKGNNNNGELLLTLIVELREWKGAHKCCGGENKRIGGYDDIGDDGEG